MGGFYPPKSTTHIVCVLRVGGSLAILMIGVKNVMSGPTSVEECC